MNPARERRTARPGSPLAWARAHPFASDSLLALLLTGVSMVPLWLGTTGDDSWSPSAPAIGLVLLINLPPAWRRSHPLAVGTLVAAAAITYGVAPYPDLGTPLPLGALLAFYTAMAYSPRRTATLIGGGACAVGLVGMLLPETDADVVDFAFVGLLLGATGRSATAPAPAAPTPPSWRNAPPGWSTSGSWRPAEPPPRSAPASPGNCTTSSPTTSA